MLLIIAEALLALILMGVLVWWTLSGSRASRQHRDTLAPPGSDDITNHPPRHTEELMHASHHEQHDA